MMKSWVQKIVTLLTRLVPPKLTPEQERSRQITQGLWYLSAIACFTLAILDSQLQFSAPWMASHPHLVQWLAGLVLIVVAEQLVYRYTGSHLWSLKTNGRAISQMKFNETPKQEHPSTRSGRAHLVPGQGACGFGDKSKIDLPAKPHEALSQTDPLSPMAESQVTVSKRHWSNLYTYTDACGCSQRIRPSTLWQTIVGLFTGTTRHPINLVICAQHRLFRNEHSIEREHREKMPVL